MKKNIKILLIVICALISGILIFKGIDVMMLRTDSGWDSSYDSGGWDSGGWDSGGWDNDYDYDYDGSGGYQLTTKEDYVMFFIIVAFYVGVAILIAYISSKKSTLKTNFINSNYTAKYVPILTDVEKEKNNHRLEELTGVNLETLKSEVFNIYKDIQIAWMNFDYDKLRTLCNDEIYNTYKIQLETLNLKGEKNVMENFVLNDLYFLAPFAKKEVVMFTVILKVSQNDYVIDVKNNAVVHGDKYHVMNMTYKLIYEYRKPKTNKCPNCNALIKPETSKCDYCNSVIVQGKGKIVLVRKEALDQK